MLLSLELSSFPVGDVLPLSYQRGIWLNYLDSAYQSPPG